MSRSPWCVAVVGFVALGLGPWSEALAQPTFELGFKAGLSLAKLSGSDLEESDSGTFDLGGGFTGVGTVSSGIGDTKPGFVGGGYAMVHFSDRLGVRLEALYSMKGGQGDNSGSLDVYDPTNVFVETVTISGTNHLSINYFEVPLLGVASFPTGTASAFEFFAGPSFAFKTSAELKEKITVSTFGASQTETQTTDLSDSFKSTDVGGVLGAGLTFHRDTHPLFVEARWTIGFTEIDNTGSGADWKNSAIAINLGVGFPMVNTAR